MIRFHQTSKKLFAALAHNGRRGGGQLTQVDLDVSLLRADRLVATLINEDLIMLCVCPIYACIPYRFFSPLFRNTWKSLERLSYYTWVLKAHPLMIILLKRARRRSTFSCYRSSRDSHEVFHLSVHPIHSVYAECGPLSRGLGSSLRHKTSMQLPPRQEPQVTHPAHHPPAQAANKATSSESTATPIKPWQEHSSMLVTHADQDLYPVEARGISLYAFWDSRNPIAAAPIEISKDIGVGTKTYGLWTVRHLIWQPGQNKASLTAAQVGSIVRALLNRLRELYAANPPMYLIFHVEELLVTKLPPPFFPHKEDYAVDIKEGFLEKHIQPLCDLGEGSMANGWLPNRFNHYDQSSKRKGWLIISPTRALFADVSAEQVVTLANLLQPYYIDGNHGPGILPELYRDMLVLIMQWVSNQDSLEAVDQLKGLVVSGTQAIDGQVWLNFAVAGIGILIAFLLIPGISQPARLIASMGCLAAASLSFWGYSRSGKKIFLFIGWLCALAVAPCLLAWPQITSMYDAVIKFFSQL